MKKPIDIDKESSGLFLGSEPLENVRYRSAAKDDDKADGDSGDDDSSDSDGVDSDTTDSDGTDSGDSDGKD